MIVNQQRLIDVDTRPLAVFVTTAVNSVHEARNVMPDVALVTDEAMVQLNENFRGKSRTTDVLSFRYPEEQFESSDSLGDIVISIEQAARQAAENELTLEAELKQLILHGLLHLCGYDHETDDGEMDEREIELREALQIA